MVTIVIKLFVCSLVFTDKNVRTLTGYMLSLAIIWFYFVLGFQQCKVICVIANNWEINGWSQHTSLENWCLYWWCMLLSLNKHIKLIRLLHCPLFFEEEKSVSDPCLICRCQYRLHSPPFNLNTYMLVCIHIHAHAQSCLLSGYKIPGNQFQWKEKKNRAHNSHYNLVESVLCQFEFQFIFSLFSNIDFVCLPS